MSSAVTDISHTDTLQTLMSVKPTTTTVISCVSTMMEVSPVAVMMDTLPMQMAKLVMVRWLLRL